MLAALWNIPRTPEDWNIWAYHHKHSHDVIRQAINAKGGNLNDYPLYPITEPFLNDFLQYNSQMHADMDSALNLQSSDLLSVDFKDEAQKVAWISIHAREHEAAEKALGGGP